MNVGTKLALGGALAVMPMAGGLAYTVMRVDDLSRANARTVSAQHEATQLALRVMRGIELSGEYGRKLEVTEDSGYRDKLREEQERVSAWIAQLLALSLTPDEEEASLVLAQSWEEAMRADDTDEARIAANGLWEASRVALDEHAQWALAQSRETTRIAVAVAVGAIALSALVIFLLVRSLQLPLRQLIRGTRAVAGGNFAFRAKPFAQDELGEVTEAFNQMVDSLGALERLKTELLSRVSHELQSPLVAMIETNRLLLDEIPGPVNEAQRRMLELHDGAAERLMVMIRDLLDLSMLEATQPFDRKPVDLVELTQGIIAQLSPLANAHALRLDVGFSINHATVRGDESRIQQVVQNLVDNAFKYSPPKGVVHVGVAVMGADALPEPHAQASDRPYAVLRVDDEGPGVAIEERDQIFDKFVQGRSARRGVGLGLAICRQIVTAHGGVIGVGESALGGASFFATFPLAEENA